jgi:hypothetical protein
LTKTVEEQLADALLAIKDLQIRILKIENSVTIKNKTWAPEEDKFLVHLAQTINLTKDEVRNRTTKYLQLVMAFQQTHERTERAITMRLNAKYFGIK